MGKKDMRLIRLGILIAVLAGLNSLFGYIPCSAVGAANKTSVYIDVNNHIYYGDDFIVRICIDNVNNLKAYQMQIKYDRTVIKLNSGESGEEGVYPGMVGDTPVSIDMYHVTTGSRVGKLRIVGHVEGEPKITASGSGYLAEISFTAIGAIGKTSTLVIPENSSFPNSLFDKDCNKISTYIPWTGSSIEIVEPIPLAISTQDLPHGAAGMAYFARMEAEGGYSPYSWSASGLPFNLEISETGTIRGNSLQSGDYTVEIVVSDDYSPPNTVYKEMSLKVYPLGDANEDGIVNKYDVLKLIRIYLGLEPPTLAADANGDGIINMNDAVQIKRIYLGQQ
jgi:hypothetical protein